MQLNIFFLTDTHPSTGVGNTVFKEPEEKVVQIYLFYIFCQIMQETGGAHKNSVELRGDHM